MNILTSHHLSLMLEKVLLKGLTVREAMLQKRRTGRVHVQISTQSAHVQRMVKVGH